MHAQIRAARLAAQEAEVDTAEQRDKAAKRIRELEQALEDQRATFEESALKYEGLIAQHKPATPSTAGVGSRDGSAAHDGGAVLGQGSESAGKTRRRTWGRSRK